jgi:hypothetical protein
MSEEVGCGGRLVAVAEIAPDLLIPNTLAHGRQQCGCARNEMGRWILRIAQYAVHSAKNPVLSDCGGSAPVTPV